MNPIYNFGISAYAAAVRLVSGRNPKARKMLEGQKETFTRLADALQPGARYLWVHAASLGEFEQGRPLIEKVRAEMPELKILLTFFSPSGYEVRKNYDGADIICYLPFDKPGNARRFVDMVRPVAAVFVKYEFWRNYLHALRRHGVPIFLVSAIFRPRQAFFKWWGRTFRHMLRYYDHIFVQDRRSADLLAGLGLKNVSIAGDTRFDRVYDIMQSGNPIESIREFAAASPFTFVAGSSWEPDEDIFIPWLNARPDCRSIIAPHEFNRQRLEAMRSRLDGKTVMTSEVKDDPTAIEGARHLIIDCFGLLSSLYRYADVAYVGGGFGTGIHNINEAAVYGVPVIFGPNHKKFKEALDMIECGGGIAIDSADAFNRAMQALADEKERQKRGKCSADYIRSHLGATDRVLKILRPALKG